MSKLVFFSIGFLCGVVFSEYNKPRPKKPNRNYIDKQLEIIIDRDSEAEDILQQYNNYINLV
jgi:hypothetical protein